jgi:hypothetical protein
MENYIQEVNSLSDNEIIYKIAEISYIISELNKNQFIIEVLSGGIIKINSLEDFNFKIIITKNYDNHCNIKYINKNLSILNQLIEHTKKILINIHVNKNLGSL